MNIVIGLPFTHPPVNHTQQELIGMSIDSYILGEPFILDMKWSFLVSVNGETFHCYHVVDSGYLNV